MYSPSAARFVFRTCRLMYDAPKVVFIACSVHPDEPKEMNARPRGAETQERTRELHELVREAESTVVPKDGDGRDVSMGFR